MKTDKTIKFLLAVIAVNLTFLTLSESNFFPKAYANEINTTKMPHINYGLIPLNADSTITIKFSDEQLNLLRQPLPNNKIQDVNLVRINGQIPRTVGMLGGGVSLYVTEY